MKNWSLYSKEHYQFVLSQAEKKLSATIETMNIIQNRGRFQLSVGIAIIIGLIGWYVNDSTPEFAYIALIIGIQTLISVILASFGIYKYKISTLGSSPEDLLHQDFYSPFKHTEHAEKNLLYNECKDYSDRIDRNFSINRKRLKLITISSILLLLLPASTLISWFLFQD